LRRRAASISLKLGGAFSFRAFDRQRVRRSLTGKSRREREGSGWSGVTYQRKMAFNTGEQVRDGREPPVVWEIPDDRF
jgi:hypothetical protein